MINFKSNRYFGITALSGLLVLTAVIGARSDDATLLPNAIQYFMDANGKPLANGKVFMYTPTTTTAKTTWTTANKAVPQANPIPLGISGKPANPIYGDGSYRQLVKDQFNNTIWDFTTASTNGGGSTPVTPTVGDGNIVGTILPWSGLVAPPNYVFAYGQAINRADYPLFFSTVTFSSNVICTATLNVLSGLADTQSIRLGSFVEAPCVPPGAQVTAKSLNSVTISSPASISEAASATFFPWGNGNASTTFNVPDLRGNTLVGRTNMGGVASTNLTFPFYGAGSGAGPDALGAPGGSQSRALSLGNLPVYTPAGTITNGVIVNTVTGGTLGGTSTSTTVSAAGVQLLSGSTAIAVSANQAPSTFTGTSVGSATPLAIIQPSVTVNYIIKVLPDVSTAVATGVASLGGMTGVIACGTGLNCSSGTITNTVLPVPTFAPAVAIESAGGDCLLTDNTAALNAAVASVAGPVRVLFTNNCTYNFRQANALTFSKAVLLEGAASSATVLAYNPVSDGVFLKWSAGVNTMYAAGGAGMNNLTITSADTTHTKVLIQPVDVDGFRLTNVSGGWPYGIVTGGAGAVGSVCLQTMGRELSIFQNLYLQCDTPLQFSLDPNGGGADHFHFSDLMVLPGTGFHGIVVDPGVVMDSVTFDGFQTWLQGLDGIHWVDTAAANQVTAVVAAGSGYTVGQVLTVTGGTCSTPIQVRVKAINGSGGITAAVIANPGVCSVTPSNPLAVTSGAATFNAVLATSLRVSFHNVRTEQGTGGSGTYTYNIQTKGLQGLWINNSLMDSARCGIIMKNVFSSIIQGNTYPSDTFTCAVDASFTPGNNNSMTYLGNWWQTGAVQNVTGLTAAYSTGGSSGTSTLMPTSAYYTSTPISSVFHAVNSDSVQSTTYNNVGITTPVTTANIAIAAAKTFSANNTMTLSSVDGATVNFGSGGTVAYSTGGAALTAGNDTNVTLTLGGSPTTALVNAASVTAGWTGTLSAARGGTGLSAGTSGGIPYFSSTTTIASSGLLAANALMIGGGAGAAPATTTTGTGVLTALGVNVGSAGAFVTLNGAGGTPSSMVGTNITGTAAGLTAGNVTTNANLTGAVTSSGNTTSLGSFTSAQLASALTNETGTGVAVFNSLPFLIGPVFQDAADNTKQFQFVLNGITTGTTRSWTMPNSDDTFVGLAATQELTNKTLNASVGKGTWTTSGTWTLPAFTVGGTISGGGNALNNIVIGGVTPLAGTFTTLVGNTSVTSPLHYGGSAAGSTATINGTSNGSPSSAFLTLQSNGQNVGIGNTAPKAALDINENLSSSPSLVVSTSLARLQAADASAASGMEWVSYGASPQNILAGVVAGGTSASPTATPANKNMFNLRGYGYNGSSFQVGGLITIHSSATAIWSGSNQASQIDFYTTPDGSTTLAQALQISPSGGLSIGSSTDAGSGGLIATGSGITFSGLASDTAQTDNSVCVNSSGRLLKGTGTLGICLGTSSARFKHDVVPMGAGLAEVVNLAPKNFFYNYGHGDDGKRQQYGFIAEDVVKVLPGVTAPDSKGAPQSVDMLAMVPVLVNAIKQLKADNDNLRMDVLALQAKVGAGSQK